MRKRLFLTAAAVFLLAAAPAQAAPLERAHYSDSFSDDFDDCGFDVHVEGTAEGVFMLKTRNGNPTPFYFDNYEVHLTYSANGKSFTQDANGLYKDLRITLVEGTIYRFEAIETGQPFVARDSDGNVVYRDRGFLGRTFLDDTKGDTDLDNDEFIEGSFEIFRDAGDHTGFYIDFCEDLVVPLLG